MDIRPKKSLGQHFLNSPAALAKIIGAAKIVPGEIVLEIGPGTGVLTSALLAAGERVIAVEKDDRAYELLQEKLSKALTAGTFILHHADILKIDRSGLGLKDGAYAVVANIPYYITGAILESFLEYEPRPNRMVLLVQKEVADRIVATDKKESILSISVKAFGTPKIVAKVPRGAFMPPPKVDSAILEIEDVSDRRFSEKRLEIRRFFDIVKAGFTHKRKFVRRNLGEVIETARLNAAWEDLGLDERARAEDIRLEQWFDICLKTKKLL